MINLNGTSPSLFIVKITVCTLLHLQDYNCVAMKNDSLKEAAKIGVIAAGTVWSGLELANSYSPEARQARSNRLKFQIKNNTAVDTFRENANQTLDNAFKNNIYGYPIIRYFTGKNFIKKTVGGATYLACIGAIEELPSVKNIFVTPIKKK